MGFFSQASETVNKVEESKRGGCFGGCGSTPTTRGAGFMVCGDSLGWLMLSISKWPFGVDEVKLAPGYSMVILPPAA